MLGKYKLNAIEVLIYKALIDSYISNGELDSVNYVLREYNEIKISVWYIKPMEIYCGICKKNTSKENSKVRKTKQNRLTPSSNCRVYSKKKSMVNKVLCKRIVAEYIINDLLSRNSCREYYK